MKTVRFFLLFSAFAFLLSDVRPVHAQEPGDDPNWRERELEKLQKEVQELEKRAQEMEKRAEALRKQYEALVRELEISMNKLPMTRQSRWLDRWDYGPISSQYKSNLLPHP